MTTQIAELIKPEDIVVAPARRGRVAMLDETEARALTTKIQHVGVRLWLLVAEAHDRQAWAALGYESWKQYATEELQMSESRSYQVLEQARVMRAIAEAGADPNLIEPPTARDVKLLKDDIAGVKRVTRSAIKRGTPVEDAIGELAARHKKTRRTTHTETETDNVYTITSLPAAAPVDEGEVVKVPAGHVRCPGCKGQGIVERFMAKPIRDLVRQLG